MWKPTEDFKYTFEGSSTKPSRRKERRNERGAGSNRAGKREPSKVPMERADSPSTSSIKSQVPMEPRTAFAEAELIALSNEQTLETASPTTNQTTAGIRWKGDREGAQHRMTSPEDLSYLSENGGVPEETIQRQEMLRRRLDEAAEQYWIIAHFIQDERAAGRVTTIASSLRHGEALVGVECVRVTILPTRSLISASLLAIIRSLGVVYAREDAEQDAFQCSNNHSVKVCQEHTVELQEHEQYREWFNGLSNFGLVIVCRSSGHVFTQLATSVVAPILNQCRVRLQVRGAIVLTYVAGLRCQNSSVATDRPGCALIVSLCAQLVEAIRIDPVLDLDLQEALEDIHSCASDGSRIIALRDRFQTFVYGAASSRVQAKEAKQLSIRIVVDGLDYLESEPTFTTYINLCPDLAMEAEHGELGRYVGFSYALIHPQVSTLMDDPRAGEHYISL